MKKKILACGILTVFLACSFPVYAEVDSIAAANSRQEIREGEFAAEVLDDDTVIITDVDSREEECAGIPEEIGGYPVSAIGKRVFEYKTFDDLTIPETVTMIDEDAFNYITVRNSLSLPENITILEGAFSYADLPEEIVIPDGACLYTDAFSYIGGGEDIRIGKEAFIGEDCFAYSEDIKSVSVGDNAEICSGAFSYCEALESLSAGEGVQLEEGAFGYCPELKQDSRTGGTEGTPDTTKDGQTEDPDKQNADILADWNIKVIVPDGAETVLNGSDNCYYIYPEETGSIPYVLLTTYAYDSADTFIEDLTDYMKSVYEDLEVTAEPVEKTIGSKSCTEIDYGYTVSGYEVLDRRIVTVSDGTAYMFASKEIPELDLMVGTLLEDVAADSVFLTEETGTPDTEPTGKEPADKEPAGTNTSGTDTPDTGTASGGAFADFYDYQNPDGTYSYYFTQGVFVTMDKDWYQKTMVIPTENGATFYHKASYYAWQEKGYEEGGRLFTISATVNTDFQNLPSFEYIGFDEEEAMNYFAILPTDYQAYAEDEEIRAEYDSLWAGVKDVIAGIELQ